MFSPFVSPERLVIAIDVKPVFVHVRQEIGAILRLENVGDVGVGASIIAIGFIGAITIVGPNNSLEMNLKKQEFIYEELDFFFLMP